MACWLGFDKSFPLVAAFVLVPFLSEAATLNVPSVTYPTIQSGINAAQTGDTVLVADGVYTGAGNRDIAFRGRDIVLRSVNGSQYTIIDCEGSPIQHHRGLVLTMGETVACWIKGFTIRNGYDSYTGGGALVNYSSPTFSDCVFSDNYADVGGAVHLYSSDCAFVRCAFTRNRGNSGGAIYLQVADPAFDTCQFSRNEANWGGCLFIFDRSKPRMIQSDFVLNVADSGGSVLFGALADDTAVLVNSLVSFNLGRVAHCLGWNRQNPLPPQAVGHRANPRTVVRVV